MTEGIIKDVSWFPLPFTVEMRLSKDVVSVRMLLFMGPVELVFPSLFF